LIYIYKYIYDDIIDNESCYYSYRDMYIILLGRFSQLVALLGTIQQHLLNCKHKQYFDAT